MSYHYTVELGKETFDLTYSPGISQILIGHLPKGRTNKSFEHLEAQGGKIYNEIGPSDKAGKIRDALPQLRKADLPTDVKKALQGIQL